jgi:parallel beta-helix repeat protein
MRLYSVYVLLLLPAICFADVLNVPSEGYPSIQQAINLSTNGDTIIVAPGRYFENINFIGKAITVRSQDPNDPNTAAATIIDGNRPADINFGSVVTFSNGETANSILEGFTITGGTGSWLKVYWEYKGYLWNRCGGGIVCSNYSSPTIRKNIITNNIAGQGGGIYCYNHSNATITDNTISDNNAIINHGFADPDANDPNIYDHGDGGAIVGFQYCDLTIKNNIIQHNHAYNYGGGIDMRQWSDGTIENNHVLNNNALLGAGIYVTYTSSPHILKNTIQHNSGMAGGAGIYIFFHSDPLVEWNIISENEDQQNGTVAIYPSSEPVIRNNIICRNVTAGITCNGAGNVLIINNTISNNFKANYTAGGIQCASTSTAVIINNIITSNEGGCGIYCYSNLPTIKFNNVWNNESGNYGGKISDLTGINGNISQDPLFAGTTNYHILPESPCVNTGDPNTENSGFDIDNEERIFNQRIDIGADECVTNTADFNIDGTVDFADLLVYWQNWLCDVDDLPADFVDNGFIDFADFAVFAENWLWKGGWHVSN